MSGKSNELQVLNNDQPEDQEVLTDDNIRAAVATLRGDKMKAGYYGAKKVGYKVVETPPLLTKEKE